MIKRNYKYICMGIAVLCLAAGRTVTVTACGQSIELAPGEVVVQRAPKAGMVVASEGDVIVGIETALTPDLVAEGLAREFISRVQSLRKDAGFEVTQRIALTVDGDADLVAAVSAHQEYIQSETLCVKLAFEPVEGEALDLNGHLAKVKVDKMQI